MKKVKKILLSIFLATVLPAFLFPPLPAAGAETLTYSCGFENGSEKEWYAHGGWGGEYCTIIKDAAYLTGGSCSAHLSHDTEEGSVYITKNVVVTGGYTYRLEAYVKTEANGSRGFLLEVLYGIDSVNTNSIGYSVSEAFYSTNNKFVKIEMELVVPQQANVLAIRPRLYGKGDVYLDDVVLTETKGPEPFSVYASHVFHYYGEKQGTVTVTLDPYYGTDSEEAACKAYFKILNGSDVIKQQTVSFENNKAVFKYDVGECLKELERQYTLSVQVKKTDGTVLKEHTQGLYVFKRPTRINENGEYILDGKVFNPIYAYHVDIPTDDTPEKDNAFLQAKKAGINVVTIGMGYCRMISSPERVYETIRQLEKHDLYGIFCLYSSHTLADGKTGICSAAGCENEIRNTQMMAEALKNEKRVFAWAVMDEPLGTGREGPERYAELEKAYYEIRTRDSMHPVWICDFNTSMFEEDLKYCDVFAPDKYTQTAKIIFDTTSLAVEKAKAAGNKPVYPLVGAYANKTSPTLIAPEKLRHIIYEGIIGGADGIGIYAFSDCIKAEISPTWKDMPIYDTSVWPMMLQMGAELPILFEKVTRKPYTDESTEKYYMRHYGDRTVIIPLDSAAQHVSVPQKFGPEIILGGEERLLSGYTVQMDPFVPVLLEYGHAWRIIKEGKIVKTISEGEHTLRFAGNTADLIAALYYPNGELYRMFTAKNSTELVVTVPEGAYTLSAFAFLPGTLQPLTKKKDL